MIALVFGIGRLPAPGTFAALGALPLGWLLHGIGGIYLVVVVTLGLFALGYWASFEYLGGKLADPPEVVIDEIVGQLVTLWALSGGLTAAQTADPGLGPWVFPWPGWVAAFLLFRFFDIVKPWPVSLANKPGAFALMLDDVVAGLIGGVLMLVAAGIAHGWF